MANTNAKGKLMAAQNRKARHEYEISETLEAGIELKGTEIKSVRKGKVQLKDSWITIQDGQAWLKGVHISAYENGNRFNHDETRERRLLLHKKEILRLDQAVRIKGYTLIPLSMYITHGLAKVEVALAKGKNLHDKRQSARERDVKREIQKAMKGSY